MMSYLGGHGRVLQASVIGCGLGNWKHQASITIFLFCTSTHSSEVIRRPLNSDRYRRFRAFVAMLTFLLKVPSLINGSIAHRENYFVLIYNITGFVPRVVIVRR